MSGSVNKIASQLEYPHQNCPPLNPLHPISQLAQDILQKEKQNSLPLSARATPLNSDRAYAIRFLKQINSECLPDFEQMPTLHQDLFGQLIQLYQSEIERKILSPDFLNNKMILQLIKIFRTLEKHVNFASFIESCSKTWKVICLPRLSLDLEYGRFQNGSSLLETIEWLEKFQDPSFIYNHLSMASTDTPTKTTFFTLVASLKINLSHQNEKKWIALCQNFQASRNWFYLIDPSLGISLLDCHLNLKTKRELLESNIFSCYCFNVSITAQDKVLIYVNTNFIKFFKTGKITRFQLNHLPTLKAILNDQDLAALALKFCKEGCKVETIFELTKLNCELAKEIFRELRHRSPEVIKGIFALLDKAVHQKSFSLETLLKLFENPLIKNSSIEVCLNFIKQFPDHIDTILLLFKEKFEIDDTIDDLQRDLESLKIELEYILPIQRKKKGVLIQEIQQKMKRLKKHIQTLKQSWILLKITDDRDSLSLLMSHFCLVDRILLLDTLDDLAPIAISSILYSLLKLGQEEPSLVNSFLEVAKTIRSNLRTAFISCFLQFHLKCPKHACELIALSQKHNNAFKVVLWMGGFFKPAEKFIEELATDWLEAALCYPTVVAELNPYSLRYPQQFDGIESGESNLWLFLVKEYPTKLRELLKSVLILEIASIKFLVGFLQAENGIAYEEFSEKETNCKNKKKLLFINEGSTFYKVLLENKSLSNYQKLQFSFLIATSQDWLAFKLLKIFNQDKHFATNLLTLAVEGRNPELTIRLLHFYNKNSTSQLTQKIKECSFIDSQDFLQKLLGVVSLSRNSPDKFLYKKVLEVVSKEQMGEEIRRLVFLSYAKKKNQMELYFLLKVKEKGLTLEEMAWKDALLLDDRFLISRIDSLPNEFWKKLPRSPSLSSRQLLVEIWQKEPSKFSFACSVFADYPELDRDYLSQLLFCANDFLEPYTLERLKEVVQTKIARLKEELDQSIIKQQAYAVEGENNKLFRAIFLPKLLAPLLIEKGDFLNIHLIPLLKDSVLDLSPNASSFEKHLVWVLDEIYKNQELQKIILTADLSSNSNDQGDLLMRIILGLPFHQPLTSLDAKKTLLITLLTHIRQGKVGSCVGTSRANELKTDLVECARLLAKMLKISSIEITVKHRKETFQFLTNLNTQSLLERFVFDLDAKLYNVQSPTAKLWEVPAIQAVGSYLGIPIPEMKEWVEKTLIKFKDKWLKVATFEWNDKYSIDWKTFIQCLIQEGLSNPTDWIGFGAELAFLSQKENPLNRALEAILIGFDYGTKESLLNALKFPWREIIKLEIPLSIQGYLGKKGALWRSPSFQEFFKVFAISKCEIHPLFLKTVKKLSQSKSVSLQTFLDEIFEILNIPLFSPLRENSKRMFLNGLGLSSPAFFDRFTIQFAEENTSEMVPLYPLFFPTSTVDPILASLVELHLQNPFLLSRFLALFDREAHNRLEIVYNHDRKKGNTDTYGGKVLIDRSQAVLGKVEGILSQEAFVKLYKDLLFSSLQKMTNELDHTEFKNIKSLILDYCNSSFFLELILEKFKDHQTPWNLCSGANALKAWDLMNQSKGKYKYTDSFIPNNALEAAQKILSAGFLHYSKHNPILLVGGCLPGHSVSFMFGHPSLKLACQSDSPLEWLEKIVNLGKEVAEIPIAHIDFIPKFFKACLEIVSQEDKKDIEEIIKNASSTCTLHAIRKALLDALAKKRGSYLNLTEIECKIDTKLMELLISSQKDLSHVLHFANSNWLDEQTLQDIHFCFLFNSGSNALEMWEVNQNGSRLKKIPQSQWFNGKEWQIYF